MHGMKTIKVVLVDDHQLIRMGIKALLKTESAIDVTGEINTATNALQYINKKKPDVVLMDISLDDGDGIFLTDEVIKKNKDVKVIMLSMHVKEDFIQRSIKAGASGYILKDSPKEELIKAIKQVAKGERYFASEVSQLMVSSYVDKAGDFNGKKRKLSGLTDREVQIIKLLSDGLSNQKIANKLGISHRTVDTHRTNIMQKVKVKNVAELVKYAIVNNLIEI
ncbi:MAG: DNA-binding response regulator [Flavobacteriales bacterium]|nr:DNA-binding response regulator [Flavobacteriales bacterium]|tara:strand:+ start:1258 stop:1923 length:666 start_codon:yes stop_codon:yes gene_type:complete